MAELHEIAKQLERIADALELRNQVDALIRAEKEEHKCSPENILEEESIFKPVLETKIDTMEFTVRTHNCLQATGIRTIEELVKHNASELLRYKNFGRKCLDEIYYKLKLDYGIELKNYKLYKRLQVQH